MIKFNLMLKNLRLSKSLTQDQLALQLKKLGCKTTTKCAISQYENGKRLPDVKALIVIASFFNVSIDYLLGLDDLNNEELKFLSIYRRLNEKEKLMIKACMSALCEIQ